MQFCATCHVQELHARFNPHEMLDNAGSRIDDSCRWCHESEAIARIPDARHGLPGLLADEATLCGRCHSTHIDYFTPGHMGAAVTTDMLAAMLRTDAELGLAKGDDRTRALPLDQRNAIGCSTCHNPHQAGLFPEDSDLALGEISGTRRQIVPLRLPGTQLCIACHEK
jgi:hypothetical protein